MAFSSTSLIIFRCAALTCCSTFLCCGDRSTPFVSSASISAETKRSGTSSLTSVTGLPESAASSPVIKPAPPAPVRRTGPIFQLPTKNDALFRDQPERFFMFVDRYTAGDGGAPGTTTQVWQGGSYGFVRNVRKTTSGDVFTKFHEGIDIAPVARDADGEPLDTVHAVADGTVVYCTRPGSGSDYGNYVVISHNCGEMAGTFYSLYAHLRRIETVIGKPVKRGEGIGLLGYTGAGIDRRRAHVHLEIAMLLSDHYDDYYRTHFKLANGHGNFSGLNFSGIDPSGFLKMAKKNPGTTPADYMATIEPAFKVMIPNQNQRDLDIVRRHPFLRQPGELGGSWELTLDSGGVLLSVRPERHPVAMPIVSWVRPYAGYHSWKTRGYLAGSGTTATLSAHGARYVELLAGEFVLTVPVPAPDSVPAAASTGIGAAMPTIPAIRPKINKNPSLNGKPRSE